MTALLERAVAEALSQLRPPPRLPLSQWIEGGKKKGLCLPDGLVAEPGPIRLWAFQREIADAIGDPTIPRVTVKKCVRVGYTTILVGAIAGHVVNDPAPIMVLLPTEADGRNFVVSDLEPIFEASPVVAGVLATEADETGRNTMRYRRFPGGSLKINAARSPRKLFKDQEYLRGMRALMTYRGEWQKLSQTLQTSSAGTVAKDLLQPTKDAQASIDRLGNSWQRFISGAARAGDSLGASSGLGKIGEEFEIVATAMERINKAYNEGGLSGAFGQATKDAKERIRQNKVSWLDKDREDQVARVSASGASVSGGMGGTGRTGAVASARQNSRTDNA